MDAVPGVSLPFFAPLWLGVLVTPGVCPHLLGLGCDRQITTFN